MKVWVQIRVDEGDKMLLQKVCVARGEHVSDFLRRLLKTELAKLGYLSPDEERALGIYGMVYRKPLGEAAQ